MKVTLEISEQFPTGWIITDSMDMSRFEPDEVEEIMVFNENKGRRCALKYRIVKEG